jgi:uncharacterized protein
VHDVKGKSVQGTSTRGSRAAPPTEASFALRRQESEIRLPARTGPGRPPASASAAGSATSSSARQAGRSQPAKSTVQTGQPAARPRIGKTRERPVPPRIGVISDNHGYLDPAVLEIFAGVVHIIHAGDIVDPDILTALETVAPVTAVGGNMDAGDLAARLPRAVAGEVAGVRFVVGHKRKRLLKDLAARQNAGVTDDAALDLVVYSHDHVPAAAWVEGTLYLGPGSAGAPHEEDDGPTVAIVEVRSAGLAVCFVPLERRDASEGRERPKT